ncbi:hypothetical protein SR1949_45180 [Sphaerospermopsis reniformis]|uniref:Uncharacterized protein n=1 Tax=Sphaerospermopsis reniformis TaxID=531300 RepID=A0A480A4F1_9CYAN|nr:hypothetical protein [Sphaerospermopsis reniformis]GCL39392.1 hypothetical protein SR1949_45180 [Sphaerospermopsis reniformis]
MSALFNLLEKIKTNPGLYLGIASISNLRMFILGYRFSRSELGITNTETESDFYKNFQTWLQNRLSIHTVNAWDKIILLTCIDEKAAFDYFFQLLDEFIQRDKSQDIRPVRKLKRQSVYGFEDVLISARLDVIIRARDSYC